MRVAALIAAVSEGRNSPEVKEDTPCILLIDFFSLLFKIKLGNLKIGAQNQIYNFFWKATLIRVCVPGS